MRFQPIRTSTAVASAMLLTAAAAMAQAAPAVHAWTPTPQEVRAAQLATKKAQQVMALDARNGSNVDGDVQLYQIGRTRTRIVVHIPQNGNYAVRIYPGSDCVDNIEQARGAVALAPVNNASANAQVSQTIVDLPVEQITKDYVIDVRNATDRAALAQACGRVSR